MDYESREFSNIAELEVIMLGLPTARLEDITIEGKVSERFKAVVNESTNKAETIVGKNYLLIQHRAIFEPVVTAFKNLGVPVKGKVIVDGGKCFANVIFDDDRFRVNVSADSKVNDTINFGMRFFNSYDKTTSFGAEVYALRLICLNGMVKPIALKSIRKIHAGDKKMVIVSIKKLFTTLMEECPKFASTVSIARQNIISMQMLKELLTGWNMGEKHIKNILAKARKVDELNGYSVYNILTDVISHELSCRESTKEAWHKKYANQVLTTPIATLLSRRKIGGA